MTALPPIPLPVVYAGLAGCLLALIVATYQQNWSLRVFFLLALRLAIGWHFAFEGLHKINSHLVGPTETNRPFTSEPYFAAAEGPFGDYMRRKYLGDPGAAIAAKLRRSAGTSSPSCPRPSRPGGARRRPPASWTAASPTRPKPPRRRRRSPAGCTGWTRSRPG